MADDEFGEGAPAGGAGVNPAALDAALNGPAAATAEARAFLRQQERLTKLQAQALDDQNAFELSHLRWRRFNDQMKGGLEMMAFAIVAAIFVALGAVVWNASQSNGLVIESFSMPPDMAARGITGQVIADKLVDDLNALQRATTSSRSGASFSGDWTNDIKVEIPDTGISLGEAYRYLRNWLGNDTRLSGEVYETDNGIWLMARIRGGTAQTFNGKPGDLDALVRKAAEALFRAAQPYRYSVYVASHGRQTEADAIFRVLTHNSSSLEQAWAYGGLATSAWSAGRYDEAALLAMHARAIEPDLILSYLVLDLVARDQSHLEDEFAAMRQAEQHLLAGARLLNAQTAVSESAAVKEDLSLLLGDYPEAIAQLRVRADSGGPYTGPDDLAAAAGDAALDHDLAGANALLKE
jgi:hypothetical protein